MIHWLRSEMMLSRFDLHISANLNENSHHCVDMGIDVGRTDLEFGKRVRGTYHILFLELKTKKRKTEKNGGLRDSQIDWNAEFDKDFASDNATRAIAYGFDEAKTIVLAWLASLSDNDLAHHIQLATREDVCDV